ncbi:ABC transporter permease [Nonomuraea africana]|uniref:Peptide/nickel transport system permease protein n=1 Tax=Nonomuraea africana TaxID=46171 RepID=A0ABR9KAC9_9ACTN|nr:ABC transporter permease [Nonomuraea africana]MBE1558964.1 peptide/nickel transport system permease protein [Nonomuraea africana]
MLWLRFLVRRVGFYLAAAWVAITLNFLLPRLMPGDPADAIIAQMSRTQQLTPDQVRSIQQLFGAPDEPLWRQYLSYLGQLTRGDLGVSTAYYPTPVSEVIGSGIWWTLTLVGTTTVLAFLIGTALGVVAGARPGSIFDSVASPLSTFLGSLPFFWVALLSVLFFSSTLGWFPLGGGWDNDIPIGLSAEFVGSAVEHAVLPAGTILLSSVGGWLFGMRNMMITTAAEDYVLLGTAKGLSPRRVMFAYAARNAILPSVAGFATAIGFVVSGSLLAEIVYTYPGVGYLFYQSVASMDYPLMQALFLVVALSVLAANFVADSVYGWLDPRARETA